MSAVQQFDTPFSDELVQLTLWWPVPVGLTVAYIVGVLALQPEKNPPRGSTKKSSKTSPMSLFILAHNVLLAVYSMWTFYYGFTLFRADVDQRGYDDAMCDQGKERWNSTYWRTLVLYFYWSKAYEMIDTAIILIKNRRPMFLQWIHHAGALILMYWLTLQGNGQVWVFMVFNSFIHSLMYTYYALTSLGVSPAWKPYMTLLQLVQFVIGNVVTAGPAIRTDCHANDMERLVTFAVQMYVLALLYLFIQFARKTYFPSKPKST